jgi:aminoglycoside 2'-N-acetyltransferase I
VVALRLLGPGEGDDALLADLRGLLVDAFDRGPDGDFDEDDWEHSVGGWRVVLLADDRPLATAAVVPRVLDGGGRLYETGYVEAVATRADCRGQGHGSVVMAEVGRIVRERFELGALGTGAQHFYERLGWERWRGPSYVRRSGGRLERTPDADDGIMVLRFGTSAALNLHTSLTCDERRGDDW